MTQKANLFKGQQKKKTIPANRHGKNPHVRKGTCLLVSEYLRASITVSRVGFNLIFFAGKRFVKPSKMTKDMDTDRVSFLSASFALLNTRNMLITNSYFCLSRTLFGVTPGIGILGKISLYL